VLEINLTSAFRLSRAALRGTMKTLRPHHRHHFNRWRYRQSRTRELRRGKSRHDRQVQIMKPEKRPPAASTADRGSGAGSIESPMTDVLNETQKERILSAVPASRLEAGADVAAAARRHLSSEEAGYVTGQTLRCRYGGTAMI